VPPRAQLDRVRTTMSSKPNTVREMKLKLKDLASNVQSLKAKGEDLTPEQVAQMKEQAAEAKTLLAQLKSAETAEVGVEIDEIDADMKALFRPDRPPMGGDGSSDGSRVNPHLRGEAWGRASIGESLIRSDSYKAFNPAANGSTAHVDLRNIASIADATKATFTTSGATLTQYDRPPGVVLLEQQRLTVADLLGQGETMMNTIRYIQEDTFTNAATTVAEGGTKPEASWDTSEVDAAVRKIAVTAKVSNELYDDFPAMQSYIDNRMRFMVGTTEENQILNGDGNAPNLRGILQFSGIQTQAKGADSNLDALMKAITKVRAVGFFEPDAIVIHPTDWQLLKLAKDANQQYMGGGPFYSPYAGAGGYTNVGEVWGLRAVVTTAISAGTALVGAYKIGAQLYRRMGISVQMTNSNEDDFKKNLIAIRCEERLALACFRPKAFCTVTGIS
jgi:HK97 family phage major capsid protein